MFFGSRRKADEAREDELWKALLQGEARSSEEARRAITYCKDFVDTYDGLYQDNEVRWIFWQRVMIVGGVVATICGVVPIPHDWADSFGWIRGLPAGLITIAAGFLSSFTYKEDAVRHEVTSTALYNELVKFLCNAKPYDAEKDSDDVSAFLDAVSQLVDSELETWSTQVISGGSTTKP
jgi:hypothetical protein